MLTRAHPSKPENVARASEAPSRSEFIAPALLFLVAAVFLFGNLGAKYLWQDEAATAVLGSRMMRFGEPLAYDGVNLITMDDPALEDVNPIDPRTGAPGAAVPYEVERADFKRKTALIRHACGSVAGCR